MSAVPAERGLAPARHPEPRRRRRIFRFAAASHPETLRSAQGDGGSTEQLSLFPGGATGSQPVGGLRGRRSTVDVHAVSVPARAFTGDFYFTHRTGDRLWFALGDVAGKGINAAVVMAMIQEELEHRIQSCAATRCDPAVTTHRLDAFLRPLLPRNRFATAVIGNLSDDGTLVVTNAGHCPPLIARRDGRVEPIASTGPVVGMLRSSQWTSVVTRVERGETLLLYSDGLLEAPSPDGLEFGTSGIERSLRGGSAREVADDILAAVDRHARGAREDDLTLVVVQRV